MRSESQFPPQMTQNLCIIQVEHFCSIEEFRQGHQEPIYRDFFAFCAYVLPAGGRLFLQTMNWGKEIPDPGRLSLSAPEGTPERILARLTKYYPGSGLPTGKEQILAAAKVHFHFLHASNGRLDYIEMLNRWETLVTCTVRRGYERPCGLLPG